MKAPRPIMVAISVLGLISVAVGSQTMGLKEEDPRVPLPQVFEYTKPKPDSLKVTDIAGKSKEEVENVLGKPINSETVSPSNTPCPCNKLVYQNGEVEIVYMQGKSDWITINLPESEIDPSGNYFSVDRFDTYTYFKVATK